MPKRQYTQAVRNERFYQLRQAGATRLMAILIRDWSLSNYIDAALHLAGSEHDERDCQFRNSFPMWRRDALDEHVGGIPRLPV